MLYHLFEALKDYDITGQGLMGYLSFRAMLANVISMLFAFFAGEPIIRWLQRRQIGETIRDLGLEGQMQKKGTPTMGGIIIIAATLVGVFMVAEITEIYTEPWHLRYVGIPVATYIMENGLCLEEFTEQLQQAIQDYLEAGGDRAKVEKFIQTPTEE